MARVVIEQTGVLFTDIGQTRQLTARVFDEDGAAVSVPVTWSSTDELDISVSATGLAVAESSSGSTQIFAMVGDVRSPPLLAVVTAVAPGSVLVDDAQIVRGPVETDPDAPPRLDNTYSVILAGTEAPPLDGLLIGTGSQPVAGQVVNTEIVDEGVLVTLRLVPINQLFPDLEINQVLDLRDVPVEIPPDVAETFDITREDDALVFTSRPDSVEARAKASAKARGPQGTRALDDACSVSATGITDDSPPFKIEKPLIFKMELKPSVDILYTRSRGLERFLIKADPKFTLQAEPKVVLAFEGKVTCAKTLFEIPIPVGGVFSLIISGIIPVGIGLELSGKLTVADVGLALKSELSNHIELGPVCVALACGFRTEFTELQVKSEIGINAPGLDDLRLEPAFELFGFAKAEIGNRFLQSLRFEAVEAKAGLKLGGSFAPQITQVLAADYKSDYKLSLAAGIKPTKDIQSLGALLGIGLLAEIELVITDDLSVSPAGTAKSDRFSYRSGDTVAVAVELEADKLEFLFLYNVQRLLLVRKEPDNIVRLLDSVNASGAQRAFDLRFVTDRDGPPDDLFVFVVTERLPADLFALEIAKVQPPGAAVMKRVHVETQSLAFGGDDAFGVSGTAKVTESDSSAFRPRYSAIGERAAFAAASAAVSHSTEALLDSAARFASIDVNCNGDAKGSGEAAATNTSLGFSIFEVPAATTLNYAVRAATQVSSVNAFSVPLIALFRGVPEGLPSSGETFFDDPGDSLDTSGTTDSFAFLDPENPDLLFVSNPIQADSGSPSGALEAGTYTLVTFCVAIAGTAGSDPVTPPGAIIYDLSTGLDLRPKDAP